MPSIMATPARTSGLVIHDQDAGRHCAARQERAHREAAVRARARLEVAAEQAGPLAEPGQAGAAALAGGRGCPQRAGAVVDHVDRDPVGAVGDVHGGRCPRRVADGVGQALLDHPVAGQFHLGGQPGGLARHAQLGAQARRPGLLHEPGKVSQLRHPAAGG